MALTVRSMYVDVVEREAVGEKVYRVTIAASERARQPPELDFDGLSVENYMRNPVVMWAHDVVGRSPSGGLPIGRTLRLERSSDGGLVAEFEFLEEDPFARRVRNAWDRGFLRAASISWIPLETVPLEGGGWRDVRADLLEWSIVAVPADPGALREAHRRMVEALLGEEEVGLLEGPRLTAGQVERLRRALALIRGVVEEEGRYAGAPGDPLAEVARAVRELRERIRADGAA